MYKTKEWFGEWFDSSVVEKMAEERKGFATPEHINDNPETTPSKRILRQCSGYNKVLHGTLIACDIGLDLIRKDCHHFNEWLNHLEELK